MSLSILATTCVHIKFAVAIALLGSAAFASAQSPSARLQLSPADLAKCAAAAGQKVQLLKDTKSLFPEQNIDTSSALGQMREYFKITCAFSTPTFAFDNLELEQDRYQIRVKQVAERCKVTKTCISEYMEEIEATLRRCEIYKAENADLVQKLVSTARPQCTVTIDQ